MSNPRKSIKPASRVFHDSGTNSNVIHWPATSSITTFSGSLRPELLATTVAAGIPATTTIRMQHPRTAGCSLPAIPRARTSHTNVAASDPQVPGPGRKLPSPKQVAVSDTQRGGGVPEDCKTPGSVFIVPAGKVFVLDLIGYVSQR